MEKFKTGKEEKTTEIPVEAKAVETPVKAEETPVKAEETPVKAEETPVKAEETPVKAEETPVEEEENVFDKVEKMEKSSIKDAPIVDSNTKKDVIATENGDGDDALIEPEEEVEEKPFEATVPTKSQSQIEEERGVKKKANGRTLTIKEVFVTAPKTFKIEKGEKVPIIPKVTQSGSAQYYGVKMAIRFEEENLIEYQPGLRVWVNDGKFNSLVKIDRGGNGKVAQLMRLTINHMAGNKFKLVTKKINEKEVLVIDDSSKKAFELYQKDISDQAFYDYLVGKKVVIETAEGIYQGRDWFRNDIVKFL